MQAVQATGLAGTGASALLLVLALWTQPGRAQRGNAERGGTDEQARSFLLAAVVMLVAVVGFAAAGWVSPTGPSPQSIAFSQIFLLGAVDCGLTFLLLNKLSGKAVRSSEER
jgi:Ni/Fe-hydrogenase subunit HybB-like protein